MKAAPNNPENEANVRIVVRIRFPRVPTGDDLELGGRWARWECSRRRSAGIRAGLGGKKGKPISVYTLPKFGDIEEMRSPLVTFLTREIDWPPSLRAALKWL